MSGDVLVMRVGVARCCLPLSSVAETMRPPPIEPWTAGESFVLGAALVRGQVIPIIDLRRLLQTVPQSQARRAVVARVQGRGEQARLVGMLVDSVEGVRRGADLGNLSLPPLLRSAGARDIEALGRLDGALLAVLNGGSTLPDEIWEMAAAKERRNDRTPEQ